MPAADLAEPIGALSPSDSRPRALAAMSAHGLDVLPRSRHDVLVAYEQAIARAV
ncbi:MAG: hypothetical protein ACREPM_11115 [Gemmatimonadaceae bacterium]